MSIATLKRKTQAKYNNMSVGQPQFSLNGTHRSQGYVGQTMLSRSLPRTLMKGNTIKGHGGCCGFYPVKPIVQSAVTSLNDNNVVKPSVLGTDGLLATKYRWTRRPPSLYMLKKPLHGNNLNTQQDYITALQKKALREAASCQVTKEVVSLKDSNGCPVNCTYTKPESDFVAKSYSEYYLQLDASCGMNNVITTSNKTQNTPFACNN